MGLGDLLRYRMAGNPAGLGSLTQIPPMLAMMVAQAQQQQTKEQQEKEKQDEQKRKPAYTTGIRG